MAVEPDSAGVRFPPPLRLSAHPPASVSPQPKPLRNAGFRVFGTSRRAAAKKSDGFTMLACDVADDEPAYTCTSFEENLAKPDQFLDIYATARSESGRRDNRAMARVGPC